MDLAQQQIAFIFDLRRWKLLLGYNWKAQRFTLYVNYKAFMELPYQVAQIPPGPRNIEQAAIYVNEVRINSEENMGYTKYTDTVIEELCLEKGIGAKSTKHFKLEMLMCSSQEVLNNLLDDLCMSIDEEAGLLSFELRNFRDQNKLEQWVLNQLVLKASKLQTLIIVNLGGTTEENRTHLFNFVAKICESSGDELQTLELEETNSTAEQGDTLMNALADSEFFKLKKLSFSWNSSWFSDGRLECMTPLATIISRQADLKFLDLRGFDPSDDQYELFPDLDEIDIKLHFDD